jgi:hypothetical protein
VQHEAGKMLRNRFGRCAGTNAVVFPNQGSSGFGGFVTRSKGVVTLDGLLLILSLLNAPPRYPPPRNPFFPPAPAKGGKPDLANWMRKSIEPGQGLRPSIEPGWRHSVRKKGRHPKPQVTIFAAMPFDDVYDDVYFVAMAGAAKRLKGLCDRTDHSHFVGDIPAVIRQMIRASDVVICDLSEAKPNVLYETGFAHALEKKAVHICSTPLNKLPFDVSHFNTIEYHRGSTHKLIEPLVERLRAILKS